MKSIVIAGNVGKDAVTRRTPQGDAVTSWTVAVDDGFGDRKRTLWFDCGMWGNRGESVAPHIRKGGKVAVSGDLSTREHEGKTYLTVRVNDVTLQGKPADPLERREPFPGYEANRPPNREELDDEIPF